MSINQRGEELPRKRGESESRVPIGEMVSTKPIVTTPNAATVTSRLGRLRKNGMRRVRIAKMTSVWVARDSTNQPVRNTHRPRRGSTPSISAECEEVEHRAQRAEDRHEPADERDVPVRRRCSCSASTWSVGMASWLAVVEQVVEQDLAGQHRQEGQEQRTRAAAVNMLPKLLDVPINTYLMVLAKMRRPSATPVGEHVQVLFEQDYVGGVLGDVGGGVDRDADVGGVQRQRVVDAVAEEADGAAAAAPEHGRSGPSVPG